MKTIGIAPLFGMLGIIALMVTGCVQHEAVYVPTYAPPPVYAGQPAYNYPNQSVYQSTNLTAAPPERADSLLTNGPSPVVVPQPEPGTVVEAPSAPPTPPVETVPVAPGPQYTWAPGYWSWNGNAWVWIGGTWVIRPRVGVVWVPGHWGWRGRHYYWYGGHWR